MPAKIVASALLALTVACGGSRFSAETPVAPLAARTSGYLEGRREGPLPRGVQRDALRDDAELISAKDRSLCFRATVRQGEADDVSSSQWELQVNGEAVALGQERLTVRDYSASGEILRAQGVTGDQAMHLALPALAPASLRVYERQLAFCRGFADGIPQEVELELTLKRSRGPRLRRRLQLAAARHRLIEGSRRRAPSLLRVRTTARREHRTRAALVAARSFAARDRLGLGAFVGRGRWLQTTSNCSVVDPAVVELALLVPVGREAAIARSDRVGAGILHVAVRVAGADETRMAGAAEVCLILGAAIGHVGRVARGAFFGHAVVDSGGAAGRAIGQGTAQGVEIRVGCGQRPAAPAAQGDARGEATEPAPTHRNESARATLVGGALRGLHQTLHRHPSLFALLAGGFAVRVHVGGGVLGTGRVLAVVVLGRFADQLRRLGEDAVDHVHPGRAKRCDPARTRHRARLAKRVARLGGRLR